MAHVCIRHTEGTPYACAMLHFDCSGASYYAGNAGHVSRQRDARRRAHQLHGEAAGGPQMAKRELINNGTDKRYVRRTAQGQFKESDDVGRSLAQDRKRTATKKAKRGQGDKGDR